MSKKLVLPAILLITVFAGCQRKASAPSKGADAAREEKLRVEGFIGDGDEEKWGSLSFQITKVYSEHKPSNLSPWHVEGGDWTFFDCQVDARPPITLIAGVRNKPKKEKDSPFSWGEAMMISPSQEMGGRFVEVFAKALHTPPPRLRSPQPLEPSPFHTAVLGEGLKRDPKGGFGGSGGSWTATKWFPEREGHSAEVFFNYDLIEMKGEFAEKDPDYREDLLQVLAIELRDGPRPERTAESDSNISKVGPRILHRQRIADKVGIAALFSQDSKRIIFSVYSPGGGTTIFYVAPESPEARHELARFENQISEVYCLDKMGHQLLVEEVLNPGPGSSSEDPRKLWQVGNANGKKQAIPGPWGEKHFFFGKAPVSPNGECFAVGKWLEGKNDKERHCVIYLRHLKSGETRTIEIPTGRGSQIGWMDQKEKTQMVFMTGASYDRKAHHDYYLTDALTGKYSKMESPEIFFGMSKKSPDGKLVAEIQDKNKLTILDTKTKQSRTFTFHEDDLRFVSKDCVKWASPRYLVFRALRLTLIDAITMKMNYPAGKGEFEHWAIFSPDFRWVLDKKEDGLYLASIEMTKDDPTR